MPKTRRMQFNFSKGEISPLLDGRPDLAAYYESGKTVENWLISRQGTASRRFGTRMVKEVKDSSKDTILLPFEFNVDTGYILEVGDLYLRIYKNTKAPVLNAGVHVEVVTPFAVADIRTIHFTQSADILFTFHGSYQQRKLSRVSDTSWSLNLQTAVPPPSFEADTDLSSGTITCTPGATTGLGVTFTASAAVFLAADVGRYLIFGAARAEIVTFTDTTHVAADILDDFPDTNPIAAGAWLLRLSPQTTLDPNKSTPVGSQVTLTAAAAAFRAADVGKYIKIYGGVILVKTFTSTLIVKGTLLSAMGDTTLANPAATVAWTLEVASWSAARGWPRTGEFFQGRLYESSTASQPTTFWGSGPDDFDNFAEGVTANDAVEYTMATRQVNRIEWLADNQFLFLGTTGTEHRAVGSSGDSSPLGGDTLPLVQRLANNGVAPMQPIAINNVLLYVDRSRRKIIKLLFDFDANGFASKELTVGAEHITESGVRVGPLAFEKRLDQRLWFDREDGTLVTMTFFPDEKVNAFTRLTTEGTFESRAIIADPAGGADQIWIVTKRMINGTIKRFVEIFDSTLQTDCALTVTGLTGTALTGLGHLEAKMVDVLKNGAFIGSFLVTAGTVTLPTPLVPSDTCEVGLHYDSTLVTMRPGIPGTVIEGLPRSWDSLFLRVKDTRGGTVNGARIQYPASPSNAVTSFTGDVKVTPTPGWDTDGRIEIVQDQPYTMTVLCAFGTLSIGETD